MPTRGSTRAVTISSRTLLAALFALPAAAHAASSGGTQWMPTPEVKAVKCVSDCASKRRPAMYSMLKVYGSKLSTATHVVFEGLPGRADDAKVAVSATTDRSLKVKVPANAQTGPIRVYAGEQVHSKATRPVAIMPPKAPEPNAALSPAEGPRDPNGPQVETGTNRVKYFLGGTGGIVFAYKVTDNAPVNVDVSLIRAADGAVVQSWPGTTVQPGAEQKLSWDGTASGQVQPEGRYAFRLVAHGQAGEARSAQAADVSRDAFDLYHHVFPVRGSHNFGGSGAKFGAGRSGHSHQGQDVMAKCGTRMVAVRGGVVKFKQYHSSAGNYLVIDADTEDTDYAYMHLQTPSVFNVGDHVDTGQLIGKVGDTGNARGCHLHFEMWGAPGWYNGGAPFDPLPYLQAWDAYS